MTTPAATLDNTIIVKKVDSGVGGIVVTAASGTIDGAATATIYDRYDSITLVADGTNWSIV